MRRPPLLAQLSGKGSGLVAPPGGLGEGQRSPHVCETAKGGERGVGEAVEGGEWGRDALISPT